MNTRRKIQTIALFKGTEIDYITFCILCQKKKKKGEIIMFENTIAHKRILKKKALLDALAQASEEGNDWKVRQLEGEIACFDRKYYPKVFWDSSKGTYRKPREV